MGDEYDRAEEESWDELWHASLDDDDITQRNEEAMAQDRIHRMGTRSFSYSHSTMYPMIPEITLPRGGIRFPTQEERNMMRTSADLVNEAENLRQQAARLEEIAEQRSKYGVDPFKNGTVLKVDMKYRTGNRSYAYAVIKVGGKFYLSGRMGVNGDVNVVATADSSRGYTWDNFVAWLAQGDATVWRARSLEQVL